MPRKAPPPQAYTAPRLRRSIKLDRVQAADFNKYQLIYACEQCSFFDPESVHCTMGYRAENHLQERQLRTFNQTSHMAFCRFQEID